MRSFRPYFWTAGVLTYLSAPSFAQDTSPFATQDRLAQALRQSSVVIGKSIQGRVDGAALGQVVAREPPDRPLKIALMDDLPPSGKVYGTRLGYTKALHDYLGLGRGALLILTRRGPTMATDALPANQIEDIVMRNANALQTSPVEGIQSTIADLDAAVGGAKPQSDQGLPAWLLGVPILLIGGGAVWAGQRAAKKRKAMQEARLPVERLRGQVLEGLTYTDTYLDLLPTSAEAATARSERQRAAALLEQAAGVARLARTPEDYGRAEALLEDARQATEKAKAAIDKATGGTGMAVALDGTEYKATPVNPDGSANFQAAPLLTGVNPEDIPPAERAACFFCSRPARLSELTPVTVATNGQRRKVLACADDVRAVQQGATPAVRTVQVNGQPVPWYRSTSYDPYRDYYRPVGYDPYYGYGYGGGMIDGLFLGAMLSQPAPIAYPVFVNNDGYATGDPGLAMMPDNTPEIQNAGSADFFGADGSDFASGNEPSDFGNGAGDNSSDFGGSDFGGTDAGGWDSGSSDSGGWDSGGGDSGGFDSGGSDFGGSDSGGGGGDW